MSTISQELFELIPSAEFDECLSQECESIELLLEQALDSPVDYPKLRESIFPGDRVAILIQNGLPSARETLESLIRVLEKSRIETADILVVVPQAMKQVFDLVELSAADPETKTPATWRMKSDSRKPALSFEIHATDDEQAASYLAANDQGNPVYVNRSLCDSDVVIPLSCLTPNRKQSDCLYPEFSTEDTRARFRKKKDTKQQRFAEAELANDSLGLFFSIELICRPGEQVEEIICGNRTQARRIAAEKLMPLWEMEDRDGCDAAVTTIESAAETATWSNVVRAVNAAADAVVDGPIIVLTELSERPSAKIKTASGAQFEGTVPDSLSSKLQHFASILCERPVYLKSKLSQNVVEGLGLGYVESAESAKRILSAHSNPMLIRDGHLRAANREKTVG
jgi:nickel-dependent lactate racemase